MINLKKAHGPCDEITVDFGVGAERETVTAIKRVTTDMPHSGRTTSGYGSKLPTRYMIHVGNRWRRVYAICWGNASTCYIVKNGEKIIVDW